MSMTRTEFDHFISAFTDSALAVRGTVMLRNHLSPLSGEFFKVTTL